MKERKIKIRLSELEQREKKEHLLYELQSVLGEEEISIRLQSLQSLFNPFDPSPIAANSLSSDVESFLLDAVELHSKPCCLKIKVFVPTQNVEEEELVKLCITNHFKKRAEETLFKNRRVFRKWWFSLLKGTIFLAICLITAHLLNSPRFGTYSFYHVLSESFGIIGWVAIWEPATFVLYGWKEGAELLKKFMKLHMAKVEVLH